MDPEEFLVDKNEESFNSSLGSMSQLGLSMACGLAGVGLQTMQSFN